MLQDPSLQVVGMPHVQRIIFTTEDVEKERFHRTVSGRKSFDCGSLREPSLRVIGFCTSQT